MAVITISRQPGAFGEEVAARVAGVLGFLLVDRARLARFRQEMGLREDDPTNAQKGNGGEDRSAGPEDETCARLLPDILAQLAEEHDLVVLGRGGQGLFRNRPGTLHVRIIASRAFRIRQVRRRRGLSSREARRSLTELETRRAAYVRSLYRMNWMDPALYDLTLRMDRLSIEEAVNLIATAAETMKLRQVPRRLIVEDLLPETEERKNGDGFANDTEREFARFLEFYRIPYEYEPRTFPLEVDAGGRVLEAFTPDFYLPEQDLFIELTTMKQRLVTRKNRKIRKLRRLHPEVNIRIFYQRDFHNLLAKFGLLWGTSPGNADTPDGQ
ncbi:MAG TPA: cytidylate kinase family protein [Syntrophobacteraceae bacterium]|nr:cytidylate kinase family protein [Syntrophobacteraceae bacterium]